MKPNEFVKLYMQNCQYRKELSLMAAAVAEENGLVVVFGASDDLCEIRGAEDDEIDCFDGCEQRSERCHITCDKYKQFGEDLSKFRFYERKQNNDISGMIQSLQNCNTNCRRKSNWR